MTLLVKRYLIKKEDLCDIFNSKKHLILEIGFGDGNNLVNSAKINPHLFYIGSDPFLNTTAKCLDKVIKYNIKNVVIWPDDVRKIINLFPDDSISAIKILFPDPWPKTRHHKRRIIGPNTIPFLYKVMSTESELRIATDVTSYKEWILEHILYSDAFDWCVKRPNDWRVRPPDWPETRYEKKAKKAGRLCSYFLFKRRD